jgi:hypothetical protein
MSDIISYYSPTIADEPLSSRAREAVGSLQNQTFVHPFAFRDSTLSGRSFSILFACKLFIRYT